MDRPMRKLSASPSFRTAGFTLIELMVVVIIATILATIAIPSYQAQVRKSRRAEAKTALLDLAGREERYLATNGSYTNTLSTLGWTASTTASGFYSIAAPTVGAGTAATLTTSASPPTFLISASVAGAQVKDTTCTKLTIDQAGNQLSYDASNTVTTGCW
jgi:type IV pilus assembly protein PilE